MGTDIPGPGRSLRGKQKKSVELKNCSFAKRPRVAHIQPWLVAIGGWRLAVVGGWGLAVGGWRRLVVGDWWLVGVGGWRLAVGGWSQLVAVGGWWSLGVVLKGSP